jgi:hypothetical protein
MRPLPQIRKAFRKCFDAFAIASVIFGVALILGCARSYFVGDRFSLLRIGLIPTGDDADSYETDTWEFVSSHGNVCFSRSIEEGVIGDMNADLQGPSALEPIPSSTSIHWEKTTPEALGFYPRGFGTVGSSSHWAGFIVGWQDEPSALHSDIVSYVILPYWFVILFLGTVAFAGALWNRRVRRRLSSGLCARCGYDLRATPHRCPECGLIPATA